MSLRNCGVEADKANRSSIALRSMTTFTGSSPSKVRSLTESWEELTICRGSRPERMAFPFVDCGFSLTPG
jgi:hypothetical protein